MNLIVRTRNFELTPALRQFVEKKLTRLGRHLPTTDLTSLEVELTQEDTRSADDRYIAEVTLVDIHGVTLRAQERGSTAHAAVDTSVDTMDSRIKHYKGRVYRSAQAKRAMHSGSLGEVEANAVQVREDSLVDAQDGEDGDDLTRRIVRVKRFPIKPMAVEDAVFQMELLGHAFFFFHNADADQFNVIYKRNDGNYGLIEPEVV